MDTSTEDVKPPFDRTKFAQSFPTLPVVDCSRLKAGDNVVIIAVSYPLMAISRLPGIVRNINADTVMVDIADDGSTYSQLFKTRTGHDTSPDAYSTHFIEPLHLTERSGQK